MHFEFLVEEPSMEATLRTILPRIVNRSISHSIHTFQGKQDLLTKLPKRLKGYKKWITQEYRIIILIDKDSDDCYILKRKLENIATDANLTTKSSVRPGQDFQVLTRIVIFELESWFLGDFSAIKKAYPKISNKLQNNIKYSNPDVITNTWEELESILQRYQYYPGGMPKIEVAEKISKHLNISINRSPSFQIFYQGLQTCMNQDRT